MKNRLTLLIMFVLFFTSMSYGQVTNLTQGTGPFLTIQAAIDDAATVNGDIIIVSSGSFSHGINVTKSLTFRGANVGVAGNAVRGAETIIDGTDAALDMGFIIALPSLTVTIDGFTFTDCSPAHDNYSPGVDGTTDWTTNVTFTNNIVSSANALQCGNVLTYWGTVTVTNNWFTNIDTEVNSSAVVLALCQNSVVSSNVFDNINYSAISLSDNQTATINANNINTTVAQGIQLANVMGTSSVTNNIITNANTSSGADRGGIRLYGSAFTGTVTITGNSISNSFNGLAIKNGENITGKDIHVNNNNFASNSNYGLYHGGSGTLDATDNWWGNASGPSHSSNTYTAVNLIGQVAVTNNVTFVPWWSTSTGPSFAPVTTTSPVASYASIQAGVTASNPSGTVNVAAGSFSETVTVAQALTLTGTGSPSLTKFILTANPVVITGFNVATIDVSGSGKIQEAVNGVNASGNVNVAAGDHSAEDVTVNKILTLTGTPVCTVNKFILTANPVVITGFSVATIDVGVGGSIQNAISAVNTGGTINVPAGVYAEAITINKNLTIVGTGNPTVTSFTLTNGAQLGGGSGGITSLIVNINQVGAAGARLNDAVLLCAAGGTINVSGTTADYAAVIINKALTINDAGGGVAIDNGSPAMTVSATGVVINGFTFNFDSADFAIDVLAGAYNVTIVNCDFLNTNGLNVGNGVRNQGTGVVTATHNYWGDPNGPTVASSACGSGCVVSNTSTGTLTYAPWYIDIGHTTLMYIPTLIFPASSAVGITVTPNFTWSFPAGAPTYTIELATDNAFTNVVYGPVASLNAGTDAFYQLPDLNQLSNSTVYYWRIKATIGAATSCIIDSFTTIAPAMPYLTYPSNGAILSGTTTTMYWYSGMVGINYNIQIAPGSDPTFLTPGGFLLNTNTTNTYYTVNNSLFTQGATYYWRVIAKTLGGIVIDISNYWQYSMPGLPQVVGSYPVGGVTIYNNPPTLYWYPLGYNSKVTEYIVRYRRAGSAMLAAAYGGNSLANTQGIFSTTNINWFSTIPFALDGGYQYYWQVASWDGSTVLTNTSYSPEENFFVYGNPTFVTCYPSYPTAGSTVYTTTPTLYWYTNVYSPIIYYKIQIDDNADFSSVLTTVDGISGSSYTVLSSVGLASGTTYYWRVAASLTSGTSGFGSYSAGASFVVSTTGTAASVATPYPATPNSGTVIGVTNPTLTWYAYSADPLQFRVRWATNPAVTGGTFTTPTGTTGWMTSNSFVLSGLTAGATYYWQVQARLATTLVEGAWSTVAWFTTAAGSASVVPLAGSPINGTPINNTNATLSWILPTQSTSTLKYDVQYSRNADFSDAVTVSNLDKPNVEVKNLDKNSVYYWRAASTTNSGLTSSYSAPTSFNTGKTVTAIEEKVEQLPTQFELAQNYPNPFNPTTLISYALPQNAFVTLKVYDMLGREIKTLVSKEVAAGNYSVVWNGDDNFGNKVATGAYVYRITASDPSASSGQGFVSVKKMLLIK